MEEVLLAVAYIDPIVLSAGYYFINKINKRNQKLNDRIIVLETSQNVNNREFKEIKRGLNEIEKDIKILIKRGD